MKPEISRTAFWFAIFIVAFCIATTIYLTSNMP